jgi:hypothetical protein
MKHATLPIDLSAMQTTLKDYRQSIGKETKPHHYANEVRLINFAVTGSRQGCYRHLHLTRELSRAIRRVVCLNMQLIQLHVQYHDRKQSCRSLFLKATAAASPDRDAIDIGVKK